MDPEFSPGGQACLNLKMPLILAFAAQSSKHCRLFAKGDNRFSRRAPLKTPTWHQVRIETPPETK